MEVLQSNKGGSKLCFDGYMYTRHALRKTKQWWKCTLNSSQRCPGSLYTDLQYENPVIGKDHNHAPDNASVQLARLRSDMKQKALSTLNAPSQIFAECVSNTSNTVKAMLPTEDNVKRSIRRYRPQQPTPSSLAELTYIPAQYTETLGDDPKDFLLYDNGPESNARIIAFSTEENLRLLAAADTLFMDGTFDTAPPLFKQIFTIRIRLGNTYITVLYSLLQKKSRQSYHELLQTIVNRCSELGLTLNINKIVTDFEDGILRATAAVFGRHIQHQGCFYHLTQATWRKIQKLRLATHYMADPEFRLFCNTIDALAFLPTDELQQGIAYIRSITPAEPEEAEELVNYFDSTYVSGKYRQVQLNADHHPQLMMRRVPPMFPPETWSVHTATVEGNPRTNNVCEGWNNKFYTLVGSSHPSIWTCINWFQREHATVTTIIQQDSIGTQPYKRLSQKLIQRQRRLQNLCNDRIHGRKTVADFLQGVAWNICLQRNTVAADLDNSV